MRAYLTGRDSEVARRCACGRALWAILGDPDDDTALLVTLCGACDLTVSPDATPVVRLVGCRDHAIVNCPCTGRIAKND